MKWKLFICALVLLLTCSCGAKQIAGSFEVDITYDENGKVKDFHASTTKNYGMIKIEGVKDGAGVVGIKIEATKVDATSLAAIVAQSNADIAKSVSSGISNGIASTMLPGK